MSSHVYHEIYLHLNWHTKLSRPLLDDNLEPANLAWVLEYIAKQKEHHAAGAIQDRLERTRFDDDGMPLADSYQED